MCFAALAVAVGALTGKRAVAVGVTVVVLVVGYFGNTLAPQVNGLWPTACPSRGARSCSASRSSWSRSPSPA